MTLRVYTSPDTTVFFPYVVKAIPTIFLAGGITGCPNWQAELISKLHHANATVYNPRREQFDVNDKNVAYQQIKWEYERLRMVDCISFWFCKETIQPIVLFELGGALERKQKIWVGMDPDYPRRMDVITQVNLIRPVPIVYSLDALAASILIDANTP